MLTILVDVICIFFVCTAVTSLIIILTWKILQIIFLRLFKDCKQWPFLNKERTSYSQRNEK